MALIGRAVLRVPQVSSPVVLPSWFPHFGGRTIYCLIEDLESAADVPLNAPEARIEEICVALFAFEGILIDRMRRHLIANREAAVALFNYLREFGAEGTSLLDFLDRAKTRRQEVRNAAGFRPSAKLNDSLTALILRIYGGTAPDKLNRAAKILATALGLSAIDLSISQLLMAVVYRPTSPSNDRSVMAARGIILSVYGASQFISAAAHADQYPRFPINLVRSISYDIRRSLNEATEALSR